ncbi:MAG: type 4a pilus biogenesis protein PilO [Verrucomicrobia bacterium]|nr:type 4a pilus biogenesis protein PilO [Verrucomicrobiota bacterium]
MSDSLAAFFHFLRRWPYSVTCALAAVLFAGGAWYLNGKSHELERTLRNRNDEGDAMEAKLVGRSTLRQELADLRAITRRIDENLVVESNLAENLWYFYKIEEQTKAQLPELHQVSSPTTDKTTLYRRVPYSLRVSGTFEQVSAYLLALETGPRLAKITSFNLTRTDPSGRTVALDLNLELLGKK